MSVLMKALEKAAQDRDKTPAAQSAASSTSASGELSLEALELQSAITRDNGTSHVPVGSRGGSAAGSAASSPKARPGMERARSHEQAQAATVLSARPTADAGVIEWLRLHPLYFFGGFAGLFLVGYAGYVYLQIAHPGLLIKAQPVAVAPTSPREPAATPSTDTTATVPARGGADRSAGTPAQTPDSGNSQVVPLSAVFANRAEQPPPAQPAAEVPKEILGRIAPSPASPVALPPRSAATSATLERTATPPNNRIAISNGDAAAPRVNATVSEAYTALVAGQFDTAQRLYNQVLRGEPANVDALLGLAAIAQKENRGEDAQRRFLAILDVEPRHALAQSGLIALMSRADPQAAESRLKQLIARDPSPPLYFNLGNLYADQGLWPQAQQAYFQAHNLEPGNPDYTYNLAVGLEHLGQQKLALGFYRKALQLAAAKGAANFDSARIQDRITQLSARFE